jgi:hypothetical protein
MALPALQIVPPNSLPLYQLDESHPGYGTPLSNPVNSPSWLWRSLGPACIVPPLPLVFASWAWGLSLHLALLLVTPSALACRQSRPHFPLHNAPTGPSPCPSFCGPLLTFPPAMFLYGTLIIGCRRGPALDLGVWTRPTWSQSSSGVVKGPARSHSRKA